MKKNVIILLFSIAFIVSSCTADIEMEGQYESDSSSALLSMDDIHVMQKQYKYFSVEKTNALDETSIVRVFDTSGNQVGFDYDDFIEIDAFSTDFLDKNYYAGVVTAGTRFDYIPYEFDPFFEEIKEVPNSELWILDEYGKPLTDIPFDYYEFSEKDTWGNEGFDAFYGFLNGDKYCYEIKDGKFVYRYTEYSGETGNEYFGYKETVSYYGLGINVGYGVNDSAGNIILEPFHSKIVFPCTDRFIIYSGYMAHNSYSYEHMAHITDTNGNIFASYSDIYFFNFDEGSIWIAYYIGDDSHLQERFDKDKGYLGEGYWFIDKDGNRISPCFKEIQIEEGWFGDIKSLDDTIVAKDENGVSFSFSARKYMC